MAEEEAPQTSDPLRITVRPRSDDFARVSEVPQEQRPIAPWLGQEEGDDQLPLSATPTEGGKPIAPWLTDGAGPTSTPIPGRPIAPWLKTEEPEKPKDVRPMPDPASALLEGIASGWKGGVGKTAQMPFSRPTVDEASPAAAPYEWRDLWNPGRAVSKTAYALGHGTPTIASGVAGGVLGAGATGGNPIGALAGGSVGAMLGSAVQTLGPVYAEELKKTPDDVDGAWDRAIVKSGITSLFSGAGWAAFPIKFFNGPIKNMMTQAIGIQPGINVAEQATQNVAAGQDVTSNLGQSYIQGVAGGTIPAAGHLGVKIGMKGVKNTLDDVIGANKLFQDIQMATTPMAVQNILDSARSSAKDFASERRYALHHWNEMHDKLMKVANADQRRAMWDAADVEHVALQQGMTPAQVQAAGIGLSTLPPRLRQIVDVLQRDSQFILNEAKRVGIFDGDGLPSYVPRIVAMMTAEGPALPKNVGGPQNLKPDVVGIHTTTPQMKGRRHLTVEETEAAAKAKLGSEAVVVKDIATLPMATARLGEAVAGRTLINHIDSIGKSIGLPLVSHGIDPGNGWFTIRHPAFTTYRVRKDPATNKVLKDEHGNPVFDREYMYIHPGFKGPLKSVLQTGDTGKIYQGLMEVKSRAVMAIMYSPLIHNAVEWGRALGAMPMKVGTGYIYFRGNAFRHGYKFDENPFGPFKYTYQALTGTRQKDPALNPAVEHAIKVGNLVPIGKRYGIQDITGIMEEPNLKPGRGVVAKGLGAAVENVGGGAKLGDMARRGVDKMGDFWHQTLLWDRIADLQFGLYADYRQKLMKKGFDDKTATRMAGHLANRYAGALPMESMSEMARKVANLTMFSRSFTLGNIGAMKDTINGLPRDVQAQILRDSGPLMHDKAKNYMKRKARAIMAIDIALAYAATTAFQSGMRVLLHDESIGDIGREYVQRFFELEEKIKKDPMQALNLLGNIESLTEMHNNEPGRKERFWIGNQSDGTALYGRAPMGKIGEEMVSWPTSPLEMAKKKESTMLRPLIEVVQNNRGFGRKVFQPDDPSLKIAQDIAWNFLRAQVPADSIEGAWELATGQGTPDERRLSKMKVGLPLMGVTISKGAPGGPDVGEMLKTESRAKDKFTEALPEMRKLIKRGQTDEANAIMDKLNLSKELRQYVYRTTIAPSSRLQGRKAEDFYRSATPEERERFEYHLNRRRQP